MFSNYKLTTSSSKHLEDVNHAHIVSLMYKLITTAKGCDDLSIGFDRDRTRRRNELTNHENIKRKYHVRFYLKDVFRFAEHQEKATYGLGYKLTLTRNSDNAVLNKGDASNLGKVKINAIEWYVPHYTASMTQQAVLSNQIVNRIPTELQYIERSVFMKEVNTQNLWNFERGTQDGINVPIWIIIGFQHSDRHNSQNENNDTFYRPQVTSAQYIIGTEKYPDSSILLNCNDDYNQGHGQIKEAFRALANDDIFLLYISVIPITLHNNLLTFRYSGKVFELKEEFLKMITNKNYNVNLASLPDRKLMYDFAKEMHFDERRVGDKSTRDRTLIKLLKSPGLMVSASGVPKTFFLSSDPDELCDRLKLLLQEKHAGNDFDIINKEIVATVDKLLEYKCISKKQHTQFLIKRNLL